MFKRRVKISGRSAVKRRKLPLPATTEKSVSVKENDEKDMSKNNFESGDENDLSKQDAVTISKKQGRSSLDDTEKEESEGEGEGEREGITSTLTSFLNKSKPVGSSKQIKQATNLKTTVLVDYQPDICKDFKQTGYCGYGDNCKFLHSRDDFKSGWKLNKEWDQEMLALSKEDEDVKKVEDIVKDIPFKCVICGDDYKNPVVTSCQHYFCNKCFFQEIKKNNNRCVICGKDTHGTAKVATDLRRLLASQRTRQDEE